MTFVRLNPGSKARPAVVKARMCVATFRGRERATLTVTIGGDVWRVAGWREGVAVECRWGQDEHAGMIMLAPPPKGVKGSKLKASGESDESAVYANFQTLPDGLSKRSRPATVCRHELCQGGLIVTLPAEWWATTKENLAVRSPKPAANYAENYSDPIQEAGTQEVMGPATSPTPSPPSAGPAQQASVLEEISSSPASAAPSSPAAAHLTAGQQGTAADKVNARAGGRGPRVSHAAQGGQPPNGVHGGDSNIQAAPGHGETLPPVVDTQPQLADEHQEEEGGPEPTSPAAAAEVAQEEQGSSAQAACIIQAPLTPAVPDVPGLTVEGQGPGHTLVSVPSWVMQALQDRGAVDQDGMFISPASDEAEKMNMADSGPAKAQPAAERRQRPAMLHAAGAPLMWVLEQHKGSVPLESYWTGDINRRGLPVMTDNLTLAAGWRAYAEASIAIDDLVRRAGKPEALAAMQSLRPVIPGADAWAAAVLRAAA